MSDKNLNSLDIDIHSKKLSNIYVYANGFSSANTKLGSAFTGTIPLTYSSTNLSVNYLDSTKNKITIEANGVAYKWQGTIEIQIPAPRVDGSRTATELEELLQGRYPVECYREIDDEG